tara:strand:+ start:983 stop:1252 length:270 start_codon:yes stop_codon:yes gene_type:complete
MAKTRHIHQRMNQRGITQRMLDIVCDFGVECGDKQILDKGNIDLLIRHMDKLRSEFMRLRDKGGLVVVEDGEAQITAYRVGSYDRKHLV